MNELEQKVIQWSTDRNIYLYSTAQAQTLKAVSEMGELADAVIKNKREDLADAIGDVMVCLINVAHINGMTLEECLRGAWEEIKDRKGYMSKGGAFVKE